MAIERFVWTAHGQLRLSQRRLDRHEVEETIREGHQAREANDGRAQWLVHGRTSDGSAFEAIYDHPHDGDVAAVRIVSVWRLQES